MTMQDYISLVPIDTAERARTLRELIQANSPVDTGALKASWDDPRTVQILPNGVVEIDNPLPYARIQDTGGVTPPHSIDAKEGGYLHFWVGGKEIFTKHVDHPGSRIPGHHYVMQAIAEFAGTPEAQAGPPLSIQWTGGGGMGLVEIAKYILKTAMQGDIAKGQTT